MLLLHDRRGNARRHEIAANTAVNFLLRCGNAIRTKLVTVFDGLRARTAPITRASIAEVNADSGVGFAWSGLQRAAVLGAVCLAFVLVAGAENARAQVVWPLTPEMESP